MATYYMRADGSAANKAAATGPATDATKCMSVTTHNAQTYSAGDVIYISSAGGTITTALVPPSSGNSTSFVTYSAIAGQTPVITDASAAQSINSSSRSYLKFVGLTVGGGTTYGFKVAGGQGHVLEDCDITGPIALNHGTHNNLTLRRVTVRGTGTSYAFFFDGNNTYGLTVEGLNIYSANGLGAQIYRPATATLNDIVGYDTWFCPLNVQGNTGAVITGARWRFYNCVKTATSANAAVQISGNLAGGWSIDVDTIYVTGAYGRSVQVAATSARTMTSCILRNVTTVGGGDQAVYGENMSNVQILGLKSTKPGTDGVSLRQGCDDWTVDRAYVAEAGQDGVATSGDAFTAHNTCARFVITNSVAWRCRNTGFAMVDSSSGTITNCLVYHCGDKNSDMNNRGGFYSTSTGVWTVTRTRFIGNYPREVYLSAAAAAVVAMDYNSYLHLGNNVVETTFATLDGGATAIPWATYRSREPHSKYLSRGFGGQAFGSTPFGNDLQMPWGG